MTDLDQVLTAQYPSRLRLWSSVWQRLGVEGAAEIGVYKGEFAAHMLRLVPSLRHYFMIDPWRCLPDWNKPWNHTDTEFDAIYKEALAATDFAKERRTVLRGTTLESVDHIPDGTLDAAYIDGDHTLRGVTIDLVAVWPKLREGGVLCGDDLVLNGFDHHHAQFEPTLVFPLAIHFAEAHAARFWALDHNQYLIEKPARPTRTFSYCDPTGNYPLSRTTIRSMLDLRPPPSPGQPLGRSMWTRIRRIVARLASRG